MTSTGWLSVNQAQSVSQHQQMAESFGGTWKSLETALLTSLFYRKPSKSTTSRWPNSLVEPLWSTIKTRVLSSILSERNKAVEIQTRFGLESGKHHGPVYALQRNPAHTKFFLSVGDWTAKIWSEELRTPIMQTRYHSSYLTSGCWSPTRCGLFFLTRMDGFLDVWDFFYRQNEVAYSQKISDSPLTAISV